MTVIERSALLPHTAEQIFDLGADIERYPEFLDGCVGAEIHERDEASVTATLRLSRAGISHGFTTRNTMQRPERIELTLIEGPFETFSGQWAFRALGEPRAKHRCACILSWPAGSPALPQENYSTKLRLIWWMRWSDALPSSWGLQHE